MTQQPVLATPDEARIRDELQRLVLADLLGPLGGEHEEFADEDPCDRYPLGRLAPSGTPIEPDTQDDLGDAEADLDGGDREPSAPNVPSLAPSALGCTAYVVGSVDSLSVSCRWARYERVAAEDERTHARVWRRMPVSGTTTIRLREGEIDPVVVDPDQLEVVVRGRARKHDGNWLVSIFLVNEQARPPQLPARAWLFQAELAAKSPDGDAVFLPRPETASGGDPSDHAEQRRLAMAYRFHPEFAVGHGVGVHAEPYDGDPMRAREIRTVAAPENEIPFTDVPNPGRDPDLPELAEVALDMQHLADLADGEPVTLVAGLEPLVSGYRNWIDQNAATAGDPDRHLSGYDREVRDALAAARRAADRIEAGIRLLADDGPARRAFGFANRAMYLQRVHTLAGTRRRGDTALSLDAAIAEVDRVENRSWRPFQIAFVLLNLPALADPRHEERGDDRERAIADLLWFPTGGGKTEAYLGLTAFTLAVRRLQPAYGELDPSGGMAVLMRYTLRLLTIQQFQRAAALICACETLRRADVTTWGDTPFRIGLWVGGRVTPNRTDDAADWLKQQRGARGRLFLGQGSPHQLTACPWCGTAIDPGSAITVDPVRRRTFIVCPDVFCPFGAVSGPQDADTKGLPVVVVDEEIYRLLPALVIATVDKFAQLSWKGETTALFGRVRRRCQRHGYVTEDLARTDWESDSHVAKQGAPAATTVGVTPLRPPDLIIQDELHLISGPLGSLTGLYETAVDRLATWEPTRGRRVRPKVIASTATVRRAPRQIGALFYRATEVFPPPGLDADDSFFARQRPTSKVAGRRYVGVCAHGARIKSTLIRVYVAVLGAAQQVHEKYGKNPVTDPYMTLVGYFNSLRDLGGMRRLVEDDVSTRLTRAHERGLARRYDPLLKELTSRLSSADIPDILEQLALPFKADRARAERRPIDVLLATSMIAVGVDITRLGVMVVAGQPKSTAEYIQATSRVGRGAPGLVFTVFNWARPRDLSHYEKFEHFHATVYRRVEALSVTPFAYRAIDRGLTGVLVALVRDLEPAYNGNLRAQDFDRHAELADHVVRFLKRRSGDVAGENDVAAHVEAELENRLDYWSQERAAPARRLAYDRPPHSDDVEGLLRRPEEGRWRKMTCPTSLRDVEPGIRLLLLPEADARDVDELGYAPAPAADNGQGAP